MDGESKPKDEQRIADSHVSAGEPKHPNSAPATPATEQQLKQTEQNIEERMTAFERSMIRLTRGGVIAIGTGLIFGAQLYEMWDAGRATSKLVEAAKIQAEAAQKNADAAANFAQSANKLATTTKDNFIETKRYYASQQRPWIFTDINFAEGHIFNAEKRQVQFNVDLFNVGNSPAMQITTSDPHLIAGIPAKVPKDKFVAAGCPAKYPTLARPGVLPALGSTGSQMSTQMRLNTMPIAVLDKDLFGSVNSWKTRLYYVGAVKYTSGRGGTFETKWCWMFNPSGLPFSPCDFCNSVK